VVERRSFSGHSKYVEILRKSDALPKSRGKLNEAPVRKIVISFDLPLDSTSKPSAHQAPKPDAPAAKRAEPTLNWNGVSSEKFKRENELRPNPLLERDREKRRALPVCARCGDSIVTGPVEIRGVDYHRECSKKERAARFGF
jgi:hypothetical protein